MSLSQREQPRAMVGPSGGGNAAAIDALADTLAGAASGGATLLVAVPAPLAPSEALLSHRTDDAIAWAPPGGFEMAALGSSALVEARGAGRFADVASAGRALLGSVRTVGLLGSEPPAPRLYGGFAFRAGAPRTAAWQALGEACFVLPELAYVLEGSRARLVLSASPERLQRKSSRDELVDAAAAALAVLERGYEARLEPTKPRALRERPDAEWVTLVEAIRSEITRGALEKVVLARRVEVALGAEPDPAAVLYRLRGQAPECTRFLVRRSGVTFLGATPEWLARKHGARFETEAVAGSIGTGEANAGKTLLGSEKDLAEHALVLREIVKALEPLTASVEVAATPELIELRHVLHLRTRVGAMLKGAPHLIDLVERLHPTPAVGGIPTARALEWMAAHEPDERGWYAAPFGWFDAEGDGEMAVALRSGLLAGGTAELYVGSGIVQGSAPVAELTETRWKLRSLLGALGVAE